MIIQFILAGILCCTLVLALVRRHKAPPVAFAMMVLSLVGIALVLFPSIAQVLAREVGIARGVDLVTYLFMAIMLLVILDIYLRLHAVMEIQTTLVREIALRDAAARERENNP